MDWRRVMLSVFGEDTDALVSFLRVPLIIMTQTAVYFYYGNQEPAKTTVPTYQATKVIWTCEKIEKKMHTRQRLPLVKAQRNARCSIPISDSALDTIGKKFWKRELWLLPRYWWVQMRKKFTCGLRSFEKGMEEKEKRKSHSLQREGDITLWRILWKYF